MISLDLPSDAKSVSERAAAYVRMSTEHQQYSTANQLDVIHSFARKQNWEVVKQYADEGRSGLSIKGRAALSQMIQDVLRKNINYAHILVYDVSRWGRFQDPDEAAHYEFICREAGVAVHYCAEPFDNDGGLTSTIAKSLKRAMAGEYSRELSTKVFQGATRMIRMGYKQGGTAVFGLRRMLVDSTGQPKTLLKTGERKGLQTDRVIYVTGPEAEIEVVRWIFKTFVEERKGPTEIARRLNRQGILAPDATLWTNSKIGRLLRNENYIGNLVYSRTSTKLRSPSVVNPPEKWVRKENALVGIVPRELFLKAQEICAASYKRRHLSDAYLLDRLRALLNEQGYLSRSLIGRCKQQFPSPCTFKNRFGSLASAYQLVGYTPRADQRHFEISSRLAQNNRRLIDQITREIERLGVTATWDDRSHVLHINQ